MKRSILALALLAFSGGTILTNATRIDPTRGPVAAIYRAQFQGFVEAKLLEVDVPGPARPATPSLPTPKPPPEAP